MGPHRGSSNVSNARYVEVILSNKRVVDDDGAAAPCRMPAPTAPATPTVTEEAADPDTDAEEQTGTNRRIVPMCIRIVDRRTPHPDRIIDRHIDHFGILLQDFDDRLATVNSVNDLFLGC